MRLEEDYLGPKEIPDDKYYGINTVRALDNFGNLGYFFDKNFIESYLLVKKACALANKELHYLSQEKANAIVSAIDYLLTLSEDKYKQLFPLNPMMGGAGTSFNMNINEVIANLAIENLGGKKGEYSLISPVDDVNKHQSTNDTFPTALKITILKKVRLLQEKIERLQNILQRKEKEYEHIIKPGRTELQEAIPISLGREFSAFAEAIARDRWRIFKIEERIKVVNLGGTAIGTGAGAPRDYIFLVVDILRELVNLPIARAENLVDATANSDVYVEVSGILSANAASIYKISNDLRLMNLLGDLKLPSLQRGSSIMPGKVNPIIAEYVISGSVKVMANDQIIKTLSSIATFQINEFIPMLAFAILESLNLLIDLNSRLSKYIEKIQVSQENNWQKLKNSTIIATLLVPKIGYEKVEKLLKKYNESPKKLSFYDFLVEELGENLVKEVINPLSINKLGY